MSLNSDKAQLKFIYNISEMMQNHDLHYFYRGYFNQEIIVDILTLVEQNLIGNDYPPKLRKKIYNLLVEALQNITRHQVPPPAPQYENTSITAIQGKPDRYLLSTANLISNKDIPKIKERINFLNWQGKEDLKEFYKTQLVSGDITEKGGAGLGLIDMVRRSESYLAYDFYQVDANTSYFYFRMEIASFHDIPKDFESYQFSYSLDYLIKFHQIANKERLSLIYNHFLNLERTDNLLEHLKKQLADTRHSKAVIYGIAFDLLNILVRYTLSASGLQDKPIIFFLQEDESGMWLNSGCYLKKNNMHEYERKILSVKKMQNAVNDQGVEKARLKKLKALKNICYDFLDVDSKTCFLSIRVRV